MSIECSRRIDYLCSECSEKGITVVPAGRKLMKDDYVKALRKYYLNKYYGDESKVPWHLKFMLSIECLQLCRRINDLKDVDKVKVWESEDWIAEPKIDGCRMAIMWNSSEKKFHFYSRNNSAVDYLPQDYSDTILVTCKNFDYPDNFVLDAEVISSNPTVATNTQCLTQLQSTAALLNLNAVDSKKIQKNNPLKFIVFDCMYNGSSCIDKPWTERHSYAEKLVNVLKDSGFNCELNKVVRNTKDNKYAKKEFYDKYVAQGGEGAVLKNINAKYHATSSRTIDCVKVKRSTADNEASDIDAFITDYVVGNDNTRNENTIVGFVFSVKLEKDDGTIVTHPIAVCSNFSDFIKEDATKYNPDGSVTLNPEYYGRVATVKGQNISARNLRLTHAVLELWRPEKSSTECETLKESFLKSLVF
jgi:ATP-dependent DNA ligase